MKFGIALLKVVAALIVGSFMFVAGLFSALAGLPRKVQKTGSTKKAGKGNWWDYDRNSLDNDIEQISHVDGTDER